ncbi:MAG: CHAD domain-containing protein [Candidatus Riflebacteria bacterium]|nr:CHAD domain-containing protein [Candidatus Riflebacteria bacterium]
MRKRIEKSNSIADEALNILKNLQENFAEEYRKIQEKWTSDSVHDLRVACRRLRSALRTFSPYFDHPVFAEYKSGLKLFMKGFNDLRDLDVELEILSKITSPKPKHLKQQFDSLSKNFRDRKKFLDESMKKFCYESLGLITINIPAPSTGYEAPFNKAAAMILESEIDETSAALRRITWTNPEKTFSTLHILRIHIKRIRYSLELFKRFYEPEGSMVVEKLKNLQDLLGWVHDCDVICEEVQKMMKKSFKEAKELFQGRFEKIRWTGKSNVSKKSPFFKIRNISEISFFLVRRIGKERKKHFTTAKRELRILQSKNWLESIKRWLRTGKCPPFLYAGHERNEKGNS